MTYPVELSAVGDFADGYVECMLWANTYAYTESGDMVEYEAIGLHHTDMTLTESAQAALWQDCLDFLDADGHAGRLIDAIFRRPDSPDGYTMQSAGHDFALTRNGHGAGFWDRGLGMLGDALSELARPYGTRSLIVGADGVADIFE